MTPRERIVRLEGLLDRVHKNATRPRAERAAPRASAQAPTPAAITPPVAATPPAPRVVATEPIPPPPTPAPPVQTAASASSVPPWKPEPSSSVQARPSSIPPEELSEDDLIDVTTVPPTAPEVEVSVSSSDSGGDDEEEAPVSSRRSKVAESLDQAIANAAAEVDDREVPIHTPPPESGPQEAVLPVGIEAPRAPEFDDIGAGLARPASLGPTPEQLGETIELDEAEGPEIEIEVRGLEPPEPPRERPVEELEVALPRAEMPSGTYDLEVSAPVPVPQVAPPAPSTTPDHAPEVTARPAVNEADVTRIVRVSEKSPETFAELLDGSLKL